MMNDVVFDFPNKGISSKSIHSKAHDIIDAFTFGITSVVGIMHYIKTDGSDTQTKNAAYKKR